jgi:excisionase family DNA binding protein
LEQKMPKLHMADVVVARLKLNGTYYDEMTPAFGLRVGKNRKTWFVVRGRERLRTNIGHYPVISLADARKEARKLLTEEPTKADRITFNAAYDIYKEALKSKKERTQYDYTRVLDKYLQPKFGTKRLADISYDEITRITNPLAHSEKRNTLAVGRTFFRWCVRPPRRYLKHSPLEGVEIPKAGKRKRILNDEEPITVWHATVKLLQLSVPGVRELLARRQISFIKVGGALRFEKRDLIEYLKRRKVAATF